MEITTDPFIILLFTLGGGAAALAVMAPLWITAYIMESILNVSTEEKMETP
jgi:hypothetical protein